MYKIGLCQGRHRIECVEDYIFPQEVNPLDPDGLRESALRKLKEVYGASKGNLWGRELHIYVTGLSVALVAALDAALSLALSVTVWHYDRESGEYYPQKLSVNTDLLA